MEQAFFPATFLPSDGSRIHLPWRPDRSPIIYFLSVYGIYAVNNGVHSDQYGVRST